MTNEQRTLKIIRLIKEGEGWGNGGGEKNNIKCTTTGDLEAF